MRASRHSKAKLAFVLTGEDTRHFFKLLKDSIGPPEVSIDCADEITREFEGLAEMQGFENPTSKLSAQIEDRLDHMLPWWRTLYKINFLELAILLMLGGWLVLAVLSTSGLISTEDTSFLSVEPSAATNSERASRGGLDSLLATLALPIGTLWAGLLLELTKERLFPYAVFAVGMGRDRHRGLERWRWVVVIGFMVSFAASIVASQIV